MQFKFQPKSSINAEVINILVNARFSKFQNFAFLMKFSNFCMPRYMQFKFQPKSSINAEAINILVNPRCRRQPYSIFQNLSFLVIFSNFCDAKVYAVQISAKKLNPRGSYQHFSKSKMAAAAILDFSKFGISGEIFQFPVCQGICSSNFSQKAQSRRNLLTFQ